MTEETTTGSSVIKIVNQLADIIKENREDAFEQIQEFLKKNHDLSMVNCRKLWIGLLSGFWLTDKLVKQIAFADSIANLTSFIENHKDKVMWWKAYIVEIRDHWKTLDKWRLSKYYTLVRKMLFSQLDYMNTKGFDSEAYEIIDILDNDLMRLQLFEAVPIQLHCVSIILTELARLEETPQADHIMAILNVFIDPILHSISFPVRKTVLKEVCYAATNNNEFSFVPLPRLKTKMMAISKENETSNVLDTKLLNNFILHLNESINDVSDDEDPLAAIENELAQTKRKREEETNTPSLESAL
eukprot:CAMPEP_0117429440 /NCGR_PEP_ID=MMETSP0758-20121206/9003_1 /TAXON_ID=63605 /ORGANISM="Percolomonas cosmopolitus, Strain AE-1 (ATCC 50343)" /LENGTH=299 /DNA_ID=CAMNT_0005216509 /DNA_START=5 /DNA_END=901 /DNA_ORIENTATION=+